MSKNKTQKNIPERWQEKKFVDVFKIGSGKDYKHLEHGDVPVFGTGGYMLSVNKNLYSGKTVFIGRKGTIDKPFYYDGNFWTVDTLFYTYDFKDTTAEFVNLIFQKIQWKKYNEASGVPSLSKTTIEKIKFIFPPLPEQNVIVKILEIWDKYLERLSRKIEIKKNIKKGLMSLMMNCELLIVNGKEVYAPKLRLPEFSGEWESVKLGDVAEIKKGQGLSKGKLINSGKYKCILYGEIYTTYNEIIKNVVSRTNYIEGVKSVKDDVLIPASTTTSAIDLATATVILEDDVLLGGDINIIRDKKDNFNGIFLSYYLTHAKKYELARLAQGITIVHLYGKDFKKLKIELPSLKEQTAIAKILTTADEEIEALEKKKKIIGEQKRFLLNNLVTGRIRV